MNAQLSPRADLRHDWSIDEVEALFGLPFADLMFRAQGLHREYQQANSVQLSTLLSIKTGGCPEDCAYCPQSVRYDTGLERERLLAVEEVREAATDRKSTRLNSSHERLSRMPSSA